MKTYRSPRDLVAGIKQLIAADKPSPHAPSVLGRILKLLCEGRNYRRAGVFLLIAGREVPRAFSGAEPGGRSQAAEVTAPIKIAGRMLGSLRVQPAPGHEFGSEERVLLAEVAEILALYLTGKGKYLVRKTREAVRDSASATSSETRGYQPSSDKAVPESRRAAAGDHSRS